MYYHNINIQQSNKYRSLPRDGRQVARRSKAADSPDHALRSSDYYYQLVRGPASDLQNQSQSKIRKPRQGDLKGDALATEGGEEEEVGFGINEADYQENQDVYGQYIIGDEDKEGAQKPPNDDNMQDTAKETVIQKRREQLKQNFIKATKPLKKQTGVLDHQASQIVIEPVPRELMQETIKNTYMTPNRKIELDSYENDEYQVSPYTHTGSKKGRGSQRTPHSKKVRSSPPTKLQSLNASMGTLQPGGGHGEGPSDYYGLQSKENNTTTIKDDQNDQNRFNRTQNLSQSLLGKDGGNGAKQSREGKKKATNTIEQAVHFQEPSVIGGLREKFKKRSGGSLFSRRGCSAVHSEQPPMVEHSAKAPSEVRLGKVVGSHGANQSQVIDKKSGRMHGISQSAHARKDDSLTMNSSHQNEQIDTQLVQSLKAELFKDLCSKVGGYFYKRRDIRQGMIKGFLKNCLGIVYDRRFFQIDLENLTFKYAKDEASINGKDVYEEKLRNLKSVKKNVVSMPVIEDGKEMLVERDVFDPSAQIDRGPSYSYNVFEVQTSNRLFTLYSKDGDFVCKFVLHLERIIRLKDEIFAHQDRKDKEMAKVHREFQLSQQRKIERSSLSRSRLHTNKDNRKQSSTITHNQGAAATHSFNSGSASDLNLNSSLMAQIRYQNISSHHESVNGFYTTIPKPPKPVPLRNKEDMQRSTFKISQQDTNNQNEAQPKSPLKANSSGNQGMLYSEPSSPCTPMTSIGPVKGHNLQLVKNQANILEEEEDLETLMPSSKSAMNKDQNGTADPQKLAVQAKRDHVLVGADGQSESKEEAIDEEGQELKRPGRASGNQASQYTKNQQISSKRNHIIILESVESTSGNKVSVDRDKNSALNIPVLKVSQITMARQGRASEPTDPGCKPNCSEIKSQKQLLLLPDNEGQQSYLQASPNSQSGGTLRLPSSQKQSRQRPRHNSELKDKPVSPNLNRRVLSKLLSNDQFLTFSQPDGAPSQHESIRTSHKDESEMHAVDHSAAHHSSGNSRRYNTEDVEMIKEHVQLRRRQVSGANLPTVGWLPISSNPARKPSSPKASSISQVNSQGNRKTRNQTDGVLAKNEEDFTLNRHSINQMYKKNNNHIHEELFDSAEAVWGQLKSKEKIYEQSEASAAQSQPKNDDISWQKAQIADKNSQHNQILEKDQKFASQYKIEHNVDQRHNKEKLNSQKEKYLRKQRTYDNNIKDQASKISQQMLEDQINQMKYNMNQGPMPSSSLSQQPSVHTVPSPMDPFDRKLGGQVPQGAPPQSLPPQPPQPQQPQQNIQIIQQNYNFFYPSEQSALEAKSMLAYQQLSYQHTQGFVTVEGHLAQQQQSQQQQEPHHPSQQHHHRQTKNPEPQNAPSMQDDQPKAGKVAQKQTKIDNSERTAGQQAPQRRVRVDSNTIDQQHQPKGAAPTAGLHKAASENKFSKSYDPKFLLYQFKKNSSSSKTHFNQMKMDNSATTKLMVKGDKQEPEEQSSLAQHTPMQQSDSKKSTKLKLSLSKKRTNNKLLSANNGYAGSSLHVPKDGDQRTQEDDNQNALEKEADGNILRIETANNYSNEESTKLLRQQKMKNYMLQIALAQTSGPSARKEASSELGQHHPNYRQSQETQRQNSSKQSQVRQHAFSQTIDVKKGKSSKANFIEPQNHQEQLRSLDIKKWTSRNQVKASASDMKQKQMSKGQAASSADANNKQRASKKKIKILTNSQYRIKQIGSVLGDQDRGQPGRRSLNSIQSKFEEIPKAQTDQTAVAGAHHEGPDNVDRPAVKQRDFTESAKIEKGNQAEIARMHMGDIRLKSRDMKGNVIQDENIDGNVQSVIQMQDKMAQQAQLLEHAPTQFDGRQFEEDDVQLSYDYDHVAAGSSSRRDQVPSTYLGKAAALTGQHASSNQKASWRRSVLSKDGQTDRVSVLSDW